MSTNRLKPTAQPAPSLLWRHHQPHHPTHSITRSNLSLPPTTSVTDPPHSAFIRPTGNSRLPKSLSSSAPPSSPPLSVPSDPYEPSPPRTSSPEVMQKTIRQTQVKAAHRAQVTRRGGKTSRRSASPNTTNRKKPAALVSSLPPPDQPPTRGTKLKLRSTPRNRQRGSGLADPALAAALAVRGMAAPRLDHFVPRHLVLDASQSQDTTPAEIILSLNPWDIAARRVIRKPIVCFQWACPPSLHYRPLINRDKVQSTLHAAETRLRYSGDKYLSTFRALLGLDDTSLREYEQLVWVFAYYPKPDHPSGYRQPWEGACKAALLRVIELQKPPLERIANWYIPWGIENLPPLLPFQSLGELWTTSGSGGNRTGQRQKQALDQALEFAGALLHFPPHDLPREWSEHFFTWATTQLDAADYLHTVAQSLVRFPETLLPVSDDVAQHVPIQGIFHDSSRRAGAPPPEMPDTAQYKVSRQAAMAMEKPWESANFRALFGASVSYAQGMTINNLAHVPAAPVASMRNALGIPMAWTESPLSYDIPGGISHPSHTGAEGLGNPALPNQIKGRTTFVYNPPLAGHHEIEAGPGAWQLEAVGPFQVDTGNGAFNDAPQMPISEPIATTNPPQLLEASNLNHHQQSFATCSAAPMRGFYTPPHSQSLRRGADHTGDSSIFNAAQFATLAALGTRASTGNPVLPAQEHSRQSTTFGLNQLFNNQHLVDPTGPSNYFDMATWSAPAAAAAANTGNPLGSAPPSFTPVSGMSTCPSAELGTPAEGSIAPRANNLGTNKAASSFGQAAHLSAATALINATSQLASQAQNIELGVSIEPPGDSLAPAAGGAFSWNPRW